MRKLVLVMLALAALLFAVLYAADGDPRALITLFIFPAALIVSLTCLWSRSNPACLGTRICFSGMLFFGVGCVVYTAIDNHFGYHVRERQTVLLLNQDGHVLHSTSLPGTYPKRWADKIVRVPMGVQMTPFVVAGKDQKQQKLLVPGAVVWEVTDPVKAYEKHGESISPVAIVGDILQQELHTCTENQWPEKRAEIERVVLEQARGNLAGITLGKLGTALCFHAADPMN